MDRRIVAILVTVGAPLALLGLFALWRWSQPTGSNASVPPTATPVRPKGSDDEIVNNVLTRAAALDHRHDAVEFRTLLQSIAAGFPEIKVGQTAGQCQWQRITLNRSGRKLDAIRFTTPTDGPRDLVWA